MDWMGMLSALAPLFASAAAGRAEGKINEATLAQQQNQNATSRYQAMVNAGRLKNIEQPTANMNQASRGSLLSTWQPMNITPATVPYGSTTNGAVMPRITGGPTVTPEMRQTGDAVAKAALSRQLAGNPLDTSVFPSDESLGLNALPKDSWQDKLFGYGSTGLSLLDAAKNAGLLGGSGPGATSGITVNGGPGGTPMLNPGGTATPPSGAGGGFPIAPGGGASPPLGSILDILRSMQNKGGGAGQYYAESPFSWIGDPDRRSQAR